MLKNIYLLLLVLFPILSGYLAISEIDLGNFALFLVGMAAIFAKGNFKFLMPDGYLLFVCVAIFISLFFNGSVLLRLILFTINLIIACNLVDYKKLSKYYFFVVYVCIAFFLIQETIVIATGNYLRGTIPFLNTIYHIPGSTYMPPDDVSSMMRCPSFFLEPSYFAQFLFPFVILHLFSDDVLNIKKALFVSIVIILSRSGTGTFMITISWLFWFLWGNYKTHTKIFVSLSVIATSVALFVFVPSLSDYFSTRTKELQSYGGNEMYQSSGFIRMYRGYYLYSELPSYNKILGSSDEQVDKLMFRSTLVTEEYTFLNGIQTLLIRHGLIVALLYLLHLFKMYIGCRRRETLVMVVCIIVLMAVESYYLSPRLFLVIAILYSIKKQYLTRNLNQKIIIFNENINN